jgi:hypothetical protein
MIKTKDGRVHPREILEGVIESLCTCPCCSVIWESCFGVEPPKSMTKQYLDRAREEARSKL